MWLIDTSTFELVQIVDPSHQKFAILSHTWDAEGEVTFQDMQNLDVARIKPGFQKIERTCNVARPHFRYMWIDTCCIDKSSSAELSEAINSMFYWYQCSKLCYVFLSDLEPLPTHLKESERRSLLDTRISKCRWFTRGWTLQELIAPERLEFFDQNWIFIGAKSDLEATLARITNVDAAILNHSTRLSSIPVARRMSWAARRKTTRIEDMAYCLLGIFDVNMPLLYGEGIKAFYRLQQQLASENNDLSLFAWQKQAGDPKEVLPAFGGIFADSPDDFKICSTLKRHRDLFNTENQFVITNTGFRMDATLHCYYPPTYQLLGGQLDASSKGDYILGLDCVETSERTNRQTLWIGIYLKKIENIYVRSRPDLVATTIARSKWIEESVSSTIYIMTRLLPDDIRRIQSSFQTGIVIIYDKGVSRAISSKIGKPNDCAVKQEGSFLFSVHGRDNFLGLHTVTLQLGHGTQDVVLVCCLQWTGACCELIVGLYSDDTHYVQNNNDLTRNYAQLITNLSSHQNERPDSECLKEVKDMMMTRYSNLSGELVQETIPSKVKVVETVSFNGRSSNYRRLLSIRVLERTEINEKLPLPVIPRKDYFYAILESEPPFISNMT